MKHTKECLAYQAQSDAEYEAYVAKWPNYCHKCNGYGSFDYPGTYDEPPGHEPCTCVEEGRCPRCGKHSIVWLVSLDEYEAHLRYQWDYPDGDVPFCPLCGWIDSYDEQTPGCPEPWECDCWMVDVDIPDDGRTLEDLPFGSW